MGIIMNSIALRATVCCVLLFGISELAAQQLPQLRDRARAVGTEKSALCWMASVFVQGAMTGSDVPNAQQTVEFAQNLTNIYNQYGVLLVGQEQFNQTIRNLGGRFKSLPEAEKVKTWQMCTTAWQG